MRRTPNARGVPGGREWHAAGVERVAQELGTDLRRGLCDAEAAARLGRDGPNVMTARKGRSWWTRLLLQFHTPLVYILLVAGAITLVLKEHVDSVVIFSVVLANAIIGFVQESKAVKAIDALARSMRVEATVWRDGSRRRISAAELVRGDVVIVEPGDKAPADMRVIAAKELRMDESMLTGESNPVAKRPDTLPGSPPVVLADRRNMVYAGSLVTRGTGQGIVVEVGDATEVGRINAMIASATQIATPLTRKLASFSHMLLWLIVVVASVAFGVGVLRGHAWPEMFKASVAIAVGAIPEGLPAAVTIMLAVGVSRMAQRKAIIRKLPAVEALGSTTVICSDKTGTLTQNQMTVRAVWAGGLEYEVSGAGYDPAGEVHVATGGAPSTAPSNAVRADDHPALLETLRCGVLCNDAALLRKAGSGGLWEIHGDPTEGALVVAARKLRVLPNETLTQESLAARVPRIDVVPFESDRQYMATLHGSEPDTGGPAVGGRRVCVKGSVERVLAMCVDMMGPRGERVPLDVAAVQGAASAHARRGLRVLALAWRELESPTNELNRSLVEPSTVGASLTFLGLQGMLDPPRAEVIDAVDKCQRAGIKVKMITGDHALTAATIAGMIGIRGTVEWNHGAGAPPPVLTGAEMAGIADSDLPEMAESTPVFARMTPEQKLRLVTALQGRGHVVAMTGDGVNDAPALRQSDIGVAMGIAGTEVAKEAADIVLADDNFASIEAAVEEGRSVFSNLTKFIVWTLPTNGGEAFIIVTAIMLGWPLPILPVHALYINMITAILLGMPLIFEAKEPGVMARPPRDARAPLLTYELFMRTGLVSLLLCAGAMGLFHWELERGKGEAVARTAAVCVIVVGEIFYLFSSRALLRPAWSVPLFSNLWLWAGIAAMLVVQFLFAHAPIVNRVFQSAPLDASAWARVILVGASVLVIVEIEKAIRRAVGTKAVDSA
ncbi:MAG: HAD-IC family P-type ATPase [Phycisphaeraceae bacterium]|nr:HAD-IC family P-type ATPase [Phycisphaeraceae bacterium]